MKSNGFNANDDVVSNALRDWKVAATLPPRFNEQVWHRIEVADEHRHTLWQLVSSRVDALFAKPAMAVAYMGVLTALGLALGLAHAEKKSSEVQTSLSSRYVQAIDPYQRAH